VIIKLPERQEIHINFDRETLNAPLWKTENETDSENMR
jgi:hypothetical protein